MLGKPSPATAEPCFSHTPCTHGISFHGIINRIENAQSGSLDQRIFKHMPILGRSRSVARVRTYTHYYSRDLDGPRQVGKYHSFSLPRRVRVPYSAARIGVVRYFPVFQPYLNVLKKNIPTQSNYASYPLALHIIFKHASPTLTGRHPPLTIPYPQYLRTSRNSPKPYASFSAPSDYIHTR